MKYQQEKRVNRVNYEKFFLLEKKKISDNKIVLYISGSTFNIYNVTFYPYSNKLFCNCPDSKSWAKKSDCVCKHCCFCVLKIFKNDVNIENYFNTLQFTPDETEKILQTISSINITNLAENSDQLVDAHMLDRYKDIADKDSQEDASRSKFKLPGQKNKNTECPICYDSFEESIQEPKCPTCNNSFHKICIEMWLKSGQKTCPFCRSDEWNQYLKNDTYYKNLIFN